MYFTSGTTGRPKGVVLTHRNLVANSFHKTIACGLRPSDVFLAAGPFFHVAGTAPVLSLVWLGASLVVLPGFDASACLDMIETQRVTVYMPVPTMLAALATEQLARPRDVSALRLIGHAGSPITTAAIRNAHNVVPRRRARSSTTAPPRRRRSSRASPTRNASSTAGRWGPSANPSSASPSTCSIRRAIRAAPGDAGEIVVRGPNVTAGYWQDETATKEAFVDGWYRMGDVGYLDDDHHLWLLDRVKDMIVTGGENVYSTEVEEVLARHPAVLECAVFGVPDEHWVEAVHAVVVVGAAEQVSEALAEQLRDHCRASLAGFKVPKQIELRLEPLPKSGPGKVQKRELRAPYWDTDQSWSRPPWRARTPLSRPWRSTACSDWLRVLSINDSTSCTPMSHARSTRRPLAVSRDWRIRPWSG